MIPAGLSKNGFAMSEDKKIENSNLLDRRSFLTKLSAALALAGGGLAAIPFIRAMSPTRDILASGRSEFDISDLKTGQLKTVIWRKQPVFILRRTSQMIKETSQMDPLALTDPAATDERASRPDIFVALGICTHLGCVPKFMEKIPEADISGFYCPCHGGKYDSIGRRIAGPPPENLHLVPYAVESDRTIIVGAETFAGYGENIRVMSGLPKA